MAQLVRYVLDDEFFSLDVYLPDYDVALEVDGRSHFIEITERSTDRPTGRRTASSFASSSDGKPAAAVTKKTRYRRTLSTELRDMFLRRRHQGLVTVPWFELEALVGLDTTFHPRYFAVKTRSIDDSQYGPCKPIE
jgi:hypothetical protein